MHEPLPSNLEPTPSVGEWRPVTGWRWDEREPEIGDEAVELHLAQRMYGIDHHFGRVLPEIAMAKFMRDPRGLGGTYWRTVDGGWKINPRMVLGWRPAPPPGASPDPSERTGGE